MEAAAVLGVSYATVTDILRAFAPDFILRGASKLYRLCDVEAIRDLRAELQPAPIEVKRKKCILCAHEFRLDGLRVCTHCRVEARR